MNSSYEGFDSFSNDYWSGNAVDDILPRDGDYGFDQGAFPLSSASFAPAIDWQAFPWPPDAPPNVALAAPECHQHDSNRKHEPWSSPNATSSPTVSAGSNHILTHGSSTVMSQDGSTAAPTLPQHGLGITIDDACMCPRDAGDEQLVAPHVVQAIFPSPTEIRKDPAQLYDENGQPLQKRSPRFNGDLYTPLWIRGEGVNRAAFCGFCDSWHRLKDSAYW